MGSVPGPYVSRILCPTNLTKKTKVLTIETAVLRRHTASQQPAVGLSHGHLAEAFTRCPCLSTPYTNRRTRSHTGIVYCQSTEKAANGKA